MEEQIISDMPEPPAVGSFALDTARYFKAFLETDLRGALLPRIQIRTTYENGLATRMPLDEYPQLHKNLYKNVISGLSQEAFVVSQNKYVAQSDGRHVEVLARAIESLTDEQIDTFVQTLAQTLTVSFQSLTSRPQPKLRTTAATIIEANLVAPLLRGADTKSEETRFLVARLKRAATEKVLSVLLPLLPQDTDNKPGSSAIFDIEALHKLLRGAFSPVATKALLREFLAEAQTNDAYELLYRLFRNQNVLGTHQMYLYFGQISYGEYHFPLFFTEARCAHAYPSVTINFGTQVHVNVQAIEFLHGHYLRVVKGEEAAHHSESIDLPRTITIDPRKRKLAVDTLQEVLNHIATAFDIASPIKLENTNDQIVTNGGISITNNVELAVFDAANDPMIADYDALLENSNPASTTAFSTMLNDFVMKTPVRYVQETAEEWEAKSLVDKLAVDNPFPLNPEQKQAMLALSKKDCDVLVVNGGPGTGKSHFINSVVARSFIEGHSTLVLSDIAASLDSVETTLDTAFRSVRADSHYHKPWLRLGKTDDDFLGELEGAYLEKIKAYAQQYSGHQNEVRTVKNRKIQETAESINQLVQGAENINLHEIEQTVNNESRFTTYNWIQDEPIEAVGPELTRLHQAIQYIRQSEANYLLPYIESSQQKAIGEFISVLREYEKVNKSVYQRLPEFIVRYRKLLPEQQSELQSALSYIHSNYRPYIKQLRDSNITARLDINDNNTYSVLAKHKILVSQLVQIAHGAHTIIDENSNQTVMILNELVGYTTKPEDAAAAIDNYIEQVVSLRSKIFGFSGRTLVVENLSKQLTKSVPEFNLPDPEKNLELLQLTVDLIRYITGELAKLGLDQKLWKEILHIIGAPAKQIEELNKVLTALTRPAEFEFMQNQRVHEADNLLANISLLQYATDLNEVFKNNPNLATLFGIKNIGQVLSRPEAFSGRFNKLSTDLDDVKQLDECKRTIKDFLKGYPALSKRLGVNYASGNLDIINDFFAQSTTDDIKEYLAFKKKEQDITAYFHEITSDLYTKTTADLAQITTLQMSYSADTKLIAYIEANAKEFRSIRTKLAAKEQIDPAVFSRLLKAFPCILGDIRDYAAYVPLEKDLFDIVIVDEASRISIAGAMPALLRAKKVIILGDKQQYSNTGAQQFDTSIGEMFRQKIAGSLMNSLKNVPADTKNSYINRALDNLHIDNSLLTFASAIANCEITFSKYFRSSPELISYTNKRFYSDSLQCLRPRGLPLSETIKFDQVESELTTVTTGFHTNIAEAKHIIKALHDLKELGYEGTIGIITSHFEQAVLLQREIDECVIGDWFTQRQLKVMTFDTSQGEHRDYIFYSMVARPSIDRTQYMFPQSTSEAAKPSLAEQRLAVGFSRAGEILHFVISQPIKEFKGELRTALEWYQTRVTSGNSKKSGSTIDMLLPAQSLLPQYFNSTKFYKKYSGKVHFISQFSLGDYLGALMPNYRHPSYKVDFLVILDDHRIVISYDEFKENFLSGEPSKDANNYLPVDEIYNQKLLEGYNFSILKLNKFNLGAHPVDVLDAALLQAIKPSTWTADNGLLKKL